jgi:cytochrome c-type biogenesis protein CcmH/NrfG
MLWLTLLVVLLIALAVAVIAAVAWPHLRSGSQILTPHGERVMQEARDRLSNTPR